VADVLLLAPMLFVMEIGLWIFAFKGGWWRERAKAYAYWLDPSHWELWRAKRRYIQSIRTVSDRHLLSFAATTIRFQEASMEHPVLRYLGNPLMDVYARIIIKPFVRW
jgi:hypothetical protein